MNTGHPLPDRHEPITQKSCLLCPAFPYDAPPEKVGDLLAGAEFEPRSTGYEAGRERLPRALGGCRGHDRSLVLVKAGATGQPESLDRETRDVAGA